MIDEILIKLEEGRNYYKSQREVQERRGNDRDAELWKVRELEALKITVMIQQMHLKEKDNQNEDTTNT